MLSFIQLKDVNLIHIDKSFLLSIYIFFRLCYNKYPDTMMIDERQTEDKKFKHA